MTLSQNDKALLSTSLRVAAEQFNTDAHTCAANGTPRIAKQFDQQERNARDLAEQIENADEVIVKYNDC